MGKIILIGGSPTAGKSFTARKIAEELKLPWISTDTIREQMRHLVEKKKYPSLFLREDESPQASVKFLNKYSAKEIVDLEIKEGKDVWKGVKALIETDYVWGSYIVEGVAIIPHILKDFIKNRKNIKVLFLIDSNKERVRETIFKRGLWDYAKNYPDSVKEKEVEWVLEFNEFIKKEAEKYSFPIIDVGNRKDYLKKIKEIIN